jgi:hypothetical protein
MHDGIKYQHSGDAISVQISLVIHLYTSSSIYCLQDPAGASGPGPPRRVSRTVPVHSRSIPSGQRKKKTGYGSWITRVFVRLCLIFFFRFLRSVCVRDFEETNQPKKLNWKLDGWICMYLSAYVHERGPVKSLFSSSVPAPRRPSPAGRCHGKISTKVVL